jgi:dephospho-CoA kinase
MKKIGITGNQGSGKSFIVKEFSKLGVPTIMMDDVAKLVQTIYPDLIQKLQVRFPEGYPDGILDKSKMREILFFDKSGENLKDMAGLIKPYLHTEVERFYQTNSDQPFVIVESALLFEYNLQNNFDLIIFVHSDPQLRKQKALERDKITSEEYDNRMKNQLSDEFKMKNSDYTVINDFTQNVIDEVYRLYKILNNG